MLGIKKSSKLKKGEKQLENMSKNLSTGYTNPNALGKRKLKHIAIVKSPHAHAHTVRCSKHAAKWRRKLQEITMACGLKGSNLTPKRATRYPPEARNAMAGMRKSRFVQLANPRYQKTIYAISCQMV